MKSIKAPNLKFEAALVELEKIVEEMETSELPLEKLIERYENGMHLIKLCDDKLSEAEQRVEVLTRNQSISSEVKIEIKQEEVITESEKELPSDPDSSEISLF